MIEEQRNVPIRRFKEFQNADPWEQRKLGDLGKVYTGNTPPTNNKNNWTEGKGGYVWITPTDIKQLVMSSSERHLSKQGWKKARVVPENSVLITSIASIGKNAINAIPAAFNQQINAIVPEKSDAYFVLSAMVKNTDSFAALAGQTATAIINKTTFEKFKMLVPNFEEQKKIGKLFSNLDHLITLHQRKLDKLKNLKSAYLSEMFPAEGEREPKRRFPGFTGPWEQRELKDEAVIIAGGDIDKAKLKSRGTYPVLANALTNRGVVGYYDNEFRVEAPAVTVSGRGEIGHAMARKTNFTPVVRLLSVKSEHDVDFLENAINEHKFFKESTGVPQLTRPQLGNYKILFPSLEEEKKLGAFFQSFDHLITLHQRKLDKLKNLKQAYLNEMFV